MNIGMIVIGVFSGAIMGGILGAIYEPTHFDWRGLLGFALIAGGGMYLGFMLTPALMFGSLLLTSVIGFLISYGYKKSLKNK